MNALLELFNFSAENYSKNLSEGLLVFLIGIATVFSVLALILAILSLFNVFFGKSSPKKEKASQAPAVATPASYAVSSDAEIVAVIAAAIAAAESECTGAKFRVVSFKRK